MYLLRTIGLGLLLIVLAGCSLNAEPLSIQEAYDQGLIDLEFKNSGTAGGVLMMIVTGKTDRSIRITIPAGQILDNQTDYHEDMVLIAYEGRLDTPEDTYIQAKSLITKQATARYGVIEAYSLELYAEPGAETDTYAFDGFVDAELQRLVDHLSMQSSEEFVGKQLAIWALTDNPDHDTASEIMQFNEHDLAQARTFLLAAKFDPTDYRLFQE
ncbi:hypothetical protein [Herpetosiphon giganteus]|uniref:hypothetical protein n=1 Tax=Herpetosiphon giganteus TaxID=2029754 RepID=UPI001958AD60|nr:hypothetical protein [Herpetosiphon giganteus]MBM7843322.1 hypothetical protein [Herpetosiphon giganteus]